MNKEYKSMIIKEIDQLLEQVPPDDIKCDINQHINDYLYKSSLLNRKLECGICNNCKDRDLSNCEDCDIYLKKEELYKSIKSTNKIAIKNRNKDYKKNIIVFVWKTFVKVIIISIALFGITFDSTVKKLFYDYFPITSICLRQQNLKCLRTDFSREYIEAELGKPKCIYEIKIFQKSYFTTVYVDKYYTLLCYYNDADLLLGYMITSSRSDFFYQSYRSDIKLLKNSVSEARNILEEEGISGQIIKKYNFTGERLDNNKYYYECKMQHYYGALENCYIGFGFTDIGYLSNKIERNMNPEDVKINFITVFNDYNFNEYYGEEGYDMIDFINDYVITEAVAGISKGNLTNLSEDVDFNDKIDEYLNEYSKQ